MLSKPAILLKQSKLWSYGSNVYFDLILPGIWESLLTVCKVFIVKVANLITSDVNTDNDNAIEVAVIELVNVDVIASNVINQTYVEKEMTAISHALAHNEPTTMGALQYVHCFNPFYFRRRVLYHCAVSYNIDWQEATTRRE